MRTGSLGGVALKEVCEATQRSDPASFLSISAHAAAASLIYSCREKGGCEEREIKRMD